MRRITDECYERVEAVLEDIGYACEIDDDYEEWEDVASSSFCMLDDLDTEQYDMTCEAVREEIIQLFEDDENYANGIKEAFYDYLVQRREYLDFNGYYDKPDEPDEDADEDEVEEYQEEMERYAIKKEYTDVVDKWITQIGKLKLE